LNPVRSFDCIIWFESAFPFHDPVLKGAPSGHFRTREEQHLAKPKTKAAVKKKPAKTQARAAAPAKAPKKAATAKSATKPVKSSAAKAVKAVAAKTVAAKVSAAKAPVAIAAAAIEVKPAAKPRVQEKAEVLTLPAARPAEPVAPKPAPVVRKAVEPVGALRADLPPAEGFTLLVDGHFKSQFGDLKGAKAAASELKSRFPMLRIEIYDGANKARLPA
jgi:hypothetical protein